MNLNRLSTVVLGAVFFSASAFAADTLTATAAVIAHPAAGPNMVGGTGFFSVSTTIGSTVSGTPCYGVQTGCSPSGSIAIPYPLAVLSKGENYTITTQFYSLSYTGTPVIYLKQVENGQTIGTGEVAFSGPFGAGYVGYAEFSGTASSTGEITVFIEAVDESTGKQISGDGLKYYVE